MFSCVHKVLKKCELSLVVFSTHSRDHPIKLSLFGLDRLYDIAPADPPPTIGIESIGQKATFSEYGHVAYQIKRKHEMQQHGSRYFVRTLPLTHDPKG